MLGNIDFSYKWCVYILCTYFFKINLCTHTCCYETCLIQGHKLISFIFFEFSPPIVRKNFLKTLVILNLVRFYNGGD